MNRPLVALCAPSPLGLMPPSPGREPGAGLAPQALLAHGLLDGLSVHDVLSVQPPPYHPARDPETGIRNAPALRAYTEKLAAAVERASRDDAFTLVLGGDCSILLGSLLGLRRTGPVGLAFVDGHSDLQTPETSATGGAAGMDLALATGRGPALLTHFDGTDALVQDEAVVVLAHRDGTPIGEDGSLGGTRILAMDLARVRDLTPNAAATQALTAIRAGGAERIWVHLDVDVLATDAMPAVDSPQPGGLSFEELGDLIVPLLRDNRTAGLEVTIYDPNRDPTGAAGAALAVGLRKVLARVLPPRPTGVAVRRTRRPPGECLPAPPEGRGILRVPQRPSPRLPMASPLDSSLVGGHVALDLCNTVAGRDATGTSLGEKLVGYDDLLHWAVLDGLAAPDEAERLRRWAAHDPAAADAALKSARALRETLFHLFDALAQGEPIPQAPLAAFNEMLAQVAPHRRLGPRRSTLEWTWASSEALDAVLWPLVQGAADLLTSVDPRRLKRCAGDGCGFLFLDQSRNRSRRWCDMTDCGNRAKARRHRQREV